MLDVRGSAMSGMAQRTAWMWYEYVEYIGCRLRQAGHRAMVGPVQRCMRFKREGQTRRRRLNSSRLPEVGLPLLGTRTCRVYGMRSPLLYTLEYVL